MNARGRMTGVRGLVLAVARAACWPLPTPLAALGVAVLSATELSLLGIRQQSFWSNFGLGMPKRLTLASTIVIWWTLVAWGIYGYTRAAARLYDRLETCGRRRLFCCIAALPLSAAAILYLVAWLFYWRLGTFPDGDAFAFAGLNARMLAKYFWQAERTAWLSCLTACGIIVLASAFALRFHCERRRCSPSPRHMVLRQGLVLMAALNAAMLSADSVGSVAHPFRPAPDRAEATLKQWPPYSFELRYHSNPALTLASRLLAKPAINVELAGEIPQEVLPPISRIRPSGFPEISPANRRNVVLITVESLRADMILKERDGVEVMPTLARLARSGHYFPNCYATSTSSDYSDPCIVSSLYPLRTDRHHFYQRQDPWPKVRIYDVLKQYDYSTAMFSSQNETWSNMHVFYESPYLDEFFDSRSYSGPTIAGSPNFNNWLSRTGQIAGKLDDAVTVNAATDWIRRQRTANHPFFVSINLQTSHFPYQRPDGLEEPFRPGKLPAGTPFMASVSAENLDVMRNAYQNALHYLDAQIGRLTQELRQMDLDERTIVVVTGDHGEAFCESGVSGHGQGPFETILKTGLVLNAPGRLAARQDEQLASAVDIVPTILGLLGLPAHPAFQGIDLLGDSVPDPDERLLFVHCCRSGMQADAVISGTGWKFVRDEFLQTEKLTYRPRDIEVEADLSAAEPEVAGCLREVLSDWRFRQLLYYGKPSYYTWFYAPRAPRLARTDGDLLSRTARLRVR